MSMPKIPGYLEPSNRTSLNALWPRPEGVPDPLWPVEKLRAIVRDPAGWLTVEEHFFSESTHSHGGVGCVLVRAQDAPLALTGTPDWLGRHLGDVGIWDSGEFEDGCRTEDRGVTVEFFAQARNASGSSLPLVEICHPFLWYWDAFPVRNGWSYLNTAGREQALVHQEVSEGSWKIEIRALEFRQFLAASKRSAILQVDYVPMAKLQEFGRVDDTFGNDWANFSFHATYMPSLRSPAFSRLLGRYVITGLKGSRVPRFEEWHQEREYPEFIYGVDANAGVPLTHTCDPDQLGTYFDDDDRRLHYLTPVYFRREVLQPYAAEPSRYRVSATRLECLNLWGISISTNSIGLVEVYLGDLGRDLPSDEWSHWRAYNVPPEGTMDEGRFRRDFLGQWVGSNDAPGDLRRALGVATNVSRQLLGAPIWRPLPRDLNAEFESLIGPLTDDPAALGHPLLTLTKVLVDGIDPTPLKSYLGSYDKGERSLRLLGRLIEDLDGDSDIGSILRELYNFRSQGGVAHLAGSGREKAMAALGIAGLPNLDAFESVVVRSTACLSLLTDLMRARLQDQAPSSAAESPE